MFLILLWNIYNLKYLYNNFVIICPEPHGREISRNVPRRETMSSRRDDYPLPRDDGHSSKDK